MNIVEIRKLFESEFESISHKFVVIELEIMDASHSKAEYIFHPGVYVWWHPVSGVIKVGRHLTNSRKRALEHISADTGKIMAALADDPTTKILLFNVLNPENLHWVAALEIFLERTLEPVVRAGRLG